MLKLVAMSLVLFSALVFSMWVVGNWVLANKKGFTPTSTEVIAAWFWAGFWLLYNL